MKTIKQVKQIKFKIKIHRTIKTKNINNKVKFNRKIPPKIQIT